MISERMVQDAGADLMAAVKTIALDQVEAWEAGQVDPDYIDAEACREILAGTEWSELGEDLQTEIDRRIGDAVASLRLELLEEINTLKLEIYNMEKAEQIRTATGIVEAAKNAEQIRTAIWKELPHAFSEIATAMLSWSRDKNAENETIRLTGNRSGSATFSALTVLTCVAVAVWVVAIAWLAN